MTSRDNLRFAASRQGTLELSLLVAVHFMVGILTVRTYTSKYSGR